MKKYLVTDTEKGLVNINENQLLSILTGEFIKLEGTDIDKPVTGPIEFSSSAMELDPVKKTISGDNPILSYKTTPSLNGYDSINEIYYVIGDMGIYTRTLDSELSFYSSGYGTTNACFKLNARNTGATPNIGRGIVGELYYGANYDDNTYVQKKYVDDLMDERIPEPPSTGTHTLQSVNGVLTWI